ncbi:trafficking protein Mon1-domain-containing protein [Lipomyces japonicus]|uniref:trafficking protein Mon1-domain-containing protein n=1 Tax=Lipomyces japonicus TaxID=56871 RepID=UPI0034CFD768
MAENVLLPESKADDNPDDTLHVPTVLSPGPITGLPLALIDDYILSPDALSVASRSSSPISSVSPTSAHQLNSSDLVGFSKAFPLRLQGKTTTGLATAASATTAATSTVVTAISTSSPAASVSSSTASSTPTLSSDTTRLHSSGKRMPDIKSVLDKILHQQDPFAKLRASFNNSFIETDIDDDSVTVFDDYDLDDEEEDKEDDEMEEFLRQKKQFFVLSFAGKPVFSVYGSDNLISAHMGVIQALVAGFEQPSDNFNPDTSPDTLKFFTAGTTTFVVSVENPLILVAVSKLGETESQLRTQLDALHTQLLSALTKAQIVKVFTGRTNFDLRKLFDEKFMRSLAREMILGSPAILLNSIECLRLRNTVRERINATLLKQRTSSLLYGLLIADGRLVSVIRPKQHSLHPPDLQVIFSMLFHTNTFQDGREHWIPLCLPKFNNKGFLHAYIVFFRPKIALVLISASRDSFYEHSTAKELIVNDLEEDDCILPIENAVKICRYRTADIGAPAIQHFLFKSRQNVQFTMPNYEPHYPTRKAQHDLMCLYRRLHAAIHTKHTHLKVLYISRGNAIALAWATRQFEIYCVASADTPKATLAHGMDIIIAWIKREESRLFITNGAVF